MTEKKRLLFSEFEQATKEMWRQAAIDELKGADFEKKMIWVTPEQLHFEPLYVANDIKDFSYIDAAPEAFPFIKGNKISSNDWLIYQTIYVNEDLQNANEKAKYFIQKGVQAIEFHLTYFLNNNDEIAKLLDGIDLTTTQIHFSGFYSYSILLQLLKWYVQHNNIPFQNIKGSFHYDHFAYYLLHGEYYNSLQDNINELKCLIEETSKHFPNLKVITVNGHLFHNAGGSSVQELAFTLSAANEYLQIMLQAGLNPEMTLQHMRLSFAVGSSYFMEIAKLRAARILWAHIASHYTSNPKMQNIEIHATSSLWNKTVYDSYNNILRTTTEAMSAALGGCDTINTLPFDIVYKHPDEFSERIARNIQHILKEEAFFAKTIDPAAGSYYIETLTSSLATHAWKLFEKIEEMGGFIQALESGFIVDEIEQIAQQRYNTIAQRRQTIVGVNQYPNLNETRIHEIQKDIFNIKTQQNSRKTLRLFRGALAFEQLRLRTEQHVQNGGKLPVVYLIPYGNLAMRVARMQFSTNFFGLAGFKVIEGQPVDDLPETVQRVIEQNADIVVFCSSDPEYAEIAPQLAQMIKTQKPECITVIAGNPVELIDMLKQSGIDQFIHIKTNALDSLSDFQKKCGIN